MALDPAGGANVLRRPARDSDAYYQAARIDGASAFAVFRYIQLPKLRGVLMIAVLLRSWTAS